MEWVVINWNQEAIKVYDKMGSLTVSPGCRCLGQSWACGTGLTQKHSLRCPSGTSAGSRATHSRSSLTEHTNEQRSLDHKMNM